MATGRNSIQDLAELMFTRTPEPFGQVIYEGNATFTVPAGVTSISMVCVGDASVTVSATVVCRSNSTPVGTGGNGGSGGSAGGGSSGGGGGAGGYSGNGGSGGFGSSGPGGNGGIGNGGGGGGAGGGGYSNPAPAGGGVGLKGQGASGTSSPGDLPGVPGSGGVGKKYGGGLGGQTYNPGTGGTAGANLRYTNNVAVTPGQSVTVAVSNGTWDSGVRIMWGGGRSYPSNAGDIWPTGWFVAYRIWITSLAGATDYVSIGEVELRATVGGADITVPGTLCTASSVFGGTTPASNLVNDAYNTTTSCWTGANASMPAWATVQPSADATYVAELAIWPHPTVPNRAPGSLTFQGTLDGGTTWVDIKSFSGITGWAANTPKTFNLT